MNEGDRIVESEIQRDARIHHEGEVRARAAARHENDEESLRELNEQVQSQGAKLVSRHELPSQLLGIGTRLSSHSANLDELRTALGATTCP